MTKKDRPVKWLTRADVNRVREQITRHTRQIEASTAALAQMSENLAKAAPAGTRAVERLKEAVTELQGFLAS